MPLKQGIDTKGKFYQFGTGKKYYYNTVIGRKRARGLALKQGRAMAASKYGKKRN